MTSMMLRRSFPLPGFAMPIVFAIAVVGGGLLSSVASVSRAADGSSDSIDYPLVVINAASVQRLRTDAGFMFDLAEQPKMPETIDAWMVSTLKELKGIDRERPFGMMLYLRPDLVGAPIGISYIPITNLDEALETLAHGTGSVRSVEGKSGRNDIQYTENFTLRTLAQGGYLFLVGPDGDNSTLDRLFPDPAKLTARLSSQYDVSVSLMIKNVPQGIRTLFLQYLKTSSQAELQQRDEEPESAYRLRRASGDNWLELIDRVVTQGEEITIGGRMDPEKRQASIEFEIAGTSDSKLAKFFQDMAGKRTYFGNLLMNPSTVTMSVSWLLNNKQRPLFVKFFEAAQKDITDQSAKSGETGVAPLIDPLFKALLATAEGGHFDGFLQLTGNEPGKYAFLGGAKLIAGRNLPNQLTELLQFLKDNPKANGDDKLAKLELASSEIDSFPVHRLEINPPDKPGQRMFGETAHLYLYVTPQSVWFAFGGDAALDTLRQSVETAALPQDPQQNRNRVPFLFVTHANNWLPVASAETPGQKAFNEQATAAFESDNDAMQIVIKPTDSGVRVRAEFEEGFIALMGRGITKGIESGVFSGSQRQRNRNRANQAPPTKAPPSK
jgi:hypothetical protein